MLSGGTLKGKGRLGRPFYIKARIRDSFTSFRNVLAKGYKYPLSKGIPYGTFSKKGFLHRVSERFPSVDKPTPEKGIINPRTEKHALWDPDGTLAVLGIG